MLCAVDTGAIEITSYSDLVLGCVDSRVKDVETGKSAGKLGLKDILAESLTQT